METNPSSHPAAKRPISGVATRFEFDPIIRLRRRARRAARGAEAPPEGWSRSDIDPMALLAVFEPLRIRDRFVLRAYRFASGGIGNGVVWAVPEDAPFPDPQECLSGPTEPIPGSLADVPRPDGALDTFMEAIDGDGTLWSYLCASLLEREAREFGSICHGLEWTEPTPLGMDPWEQADRFPDSDGTLSPTPREGWDWRRPEPADWRPAARAVDIGVEVTFFAYDPVGQEAIIRHTDRYRTGSYVFQHERDTVALGAGGFVH